MPTGNTLQRSRSRSPARRERRRSRSRSPRRHKSRSPRRRERDRHTDRDGGRERSPSLKPKVDSSNKAKIHDKEQEVDDDANMMQMMGFSSFDTTKGKHVKGQMEGSVKIQKPKKYRQYMNRRGGFNRPLDYVM